jgi:hypothetical protein
VLGSSAILVRMSASWVTVTTQFTGSRNAPQSPEGSSHFMAASNAAPFPVRVVNIRECDQNRHIGPDR